MGLLHVLAATLYFEVTAFELDVSGCGPDLTRIERVAKIRLFGAPRYSSGMPLFIRERSAYVGPDTLNVVDEGGWSYWVAIVDSAGNQTPLNCSPGITVGIPSVGVQPDSELGDERPEWFDLGGRRLDSEPSTPGLYWVKRKGQRARLIRITRR